MSKVTAKLTSSINRGRSPATHWGHITFDAAGHAEVEVDVADLPLLVRVGFLTAAEAEALAATTAPVEVPPKVGAFDPVTGETDLSRAARGVGSTPVEPLPYADAEEDAATRRASIAPPVEAKTPIHGSSSKGKRR